MKTIRYAFVRSLPIMAGYIVLGLGFGVLLQSKGYGAGWALVMSGLIYAGSMQYVAIDLLAGGASLISAAIMTLMVNARHLFYGISMLERYKDTGAAKPYLIFALTDETYSVVCSGGVPEGEQYAFFTRAVLDAIPNLGFFPDILHCNDWHTAMLPMLLRTQYGYYVHGKIKTLLTIHNIFYQGKFGFDFFRDLLRVEDRYFTPEFMELNGCAAFLKAGCGPVHGMSFPLGGTYHVPHGESNYMLFGAIMDYYDEHKPDGEIMKFKELVSSILGCEVKDAIPEMNALLQRILPLRPLRDCGFTEADFKAFPLSVEANQQRLMTNAYYPFDLESEEAIYRKCY